MAKAIMVVKRNSQGIEIARTIEKICLNIAPDNLEPNKPYIYENNGIAIGIFNPNDVINIKEGSFYLGHIVRGIEDWFVPFSGKPEGTFALFRNNASVAELVSDAVATRTIWYIKTDEYFIASTSQRMIVSFLGSYEANAEVYPWLLSTGTLGPGMSWDRRINSLPADSTLKLDRGKWELEIESETCEFTPKEKTMHEKKSLKEVLVETFGKLNFDYINWVLPLSGGFDSRAILLLLKDKKKVRTITWGVKEALNQSGSDAVVAKKLSDYFSTEHEYYHTDIADEPIETIFKRFLEIGEGRIDHISGYADGFQIWRMLFQKGVQGIIRGDEGLGWTAVSSENDVKRYIGLNLLKDFDNVPDWLKEKYVSQKLPSNLTRRETETLEMWRDRLYHQFRIPNILAALNDLKVSYVEIANPLLAKSIIREIRNLSDQNRTEKRLFKELVNELSPSIPYAKYSATLEAKNILKEKKVVEFIKAELRNNDGKLLPVDLTDLIVKNLKVIDSEGISKKSIKQKLINRLPRWVKNKLKNSVIKTNIDFNVLGFRAFIIMKSHQMLLEDTKVRS